MASNPSLLDSLPPPPPPAGSFRVRAPVTIDDDSFSSDVECNSERVTNLSKKTGSVTSSSSFGDDGSDYEEFESGEEYETAASDRHFVGDPRGGSRGNSGLADKVGAFRPSVGRVDSLVIDEEGNGLVNHGPVIELVEEKSMQLRPIAPLSMEDDELHELVGDDGMASEEEDVRISGVVKVPSFGILERVDVAPRVKLLVDEEDEDEDVEEDEPPLLGGSSRVKQPEFPSDRMINDSLVLTDGFAGEPVTVVTARDPVKPSIEDVKHVVTETMEMNVDAKHSIEDSAPNDLEYEILASIQEEQVDSFADSECVLNENAKLTADEVVGAWEPQTEECSVEKGEVKELMDHNPGEIFSAVRLMNDAVKGDLAMAGGLDDDVTASFHIADETPDVADKQQRKSLLSDKVREESINEVPGQTENLTTEIERSSGSSLKVVERFTNHKPSVNGQIASEVDEFEDSEDHEGKASSDKSRVEALPEAAAGAQARKPISTFHSVVEKVNDNLSEEDRKMMKEIHCIRVKFSRVVHRLGLCSGDPLVAQVLNRLALAAGGHASDEFNLESAENLAMELKEKGNDDLEFSLNVLVLGKTGVGKSATINSIFGEKKVTISPFEPGTSRVKEIFGTVDGVQIRVLDTPGLRSSVKEEAVNRKILASIKSFAAKFPPDVVLYVDRLDNQARDLIDLPLLKSVTHYLTAKIWRNAVITLTHGASPIPDGPTGSPLRFESLVAQRSRVIQHAISQAVGDVKLMRQSMMHPVSVVENNTSGLKDENGQVLLPNGQSWRTQLLLLCYSLKILSEASSLEKPRDAYGEKKYFGFHRHSLSLPHLVSFLLQSRRHPKPTADQGGDDMDSDIEMVELSDSNEEGVNDYDQLPPFKPLRKSQADKLSKEQRKAYLEEYDYRVKLWQRKQWREEVRRLKEKKKKNGQDYVNLSGKIAEHEVQEGGSATNMAVPIPDLVIPPSFDGDDSSYRYRSFEPTSQLLIRPILDPQGWDHDCGYDGVSMESNNLAIAGWFPCAFALQVTKDKEEFNIHLDSSVCAKHGENGSSIAGFDIQTVGKQLAYILRSETKFRNLKMNKTCAGISITLLGEQIATGLKLEDQIVLGKRLVLVGSGGAVRTGADAACGAAFEVRLRSKDFPIDQDQSTLGFSLMKWRGGLGVMATLQSQLLVGRSSKVAIRIGMNGRRSGQITVKTTSSDLNVAVVSVLPLVFSIFKSICLGANSNSTQIY